MKWAENVACTPLYKIMVRKPDWKRPTGRWEDDIKIHLREIRWKYVDWVHLTQDREMW
jgi:hypothetical protein